VADLTSDATDARELLWRPPLAPHEPPAAAAALAAVWWRASGAPVVNTQGPDSNADCRIAQQRSDRTPSADKHAAEIENFQATAARRCYTESVPREVLLPSGPPDRLFESRSGTFIEAAHARPPRPPVNLAHPLAAATLFCPPVHQTFRRRDCIPLLTNPLREGNCREGNTEVNAGELSFSKETITGRKREPVPVAAFNLLKTEATNVLFPIVASR
jgi:hypothetical protein